MGVRGMVGASVTSSSVDLWQNQAVEGVEAGWVPSPQAQLNAGESLWLPKKPFHTKIHAIIWEQQQEHLQGSWEARSPPC